MEGDMPMVSQLKSIPGFCDLNHYLLKDRASRGCPKKIARHLIGYGKITIQEMGSRKIALYLGS